MRFRRRRSIARDPDLLRVLQESASDLVEQQMTRDRQRFAYEKQKLILLLTILLTLWIMFFLLWERLDGVRPLEGEPPTQPDMAPASHGKPSETPAYQYAI